jgi:hypothetical protein
MNKLDKLAQAVENMQDTVLEPNDLSLGCDLFDLAVSGEVGKAAGIGRFLWYHGQSGSAKSYFTKLVMAAAANNPRYDNHRIVMFDGENGSSFDTSKFFGNKLAGRLEHAKAESLDHLYDALDVLASTPSIVLVDSWEAWMPASGIKHVAASAKARAEDKEPDGTYGMEQGKIHSNRLRLLVPKLKETESILLGVSQHRDNVNKNNAYSPPDVIPGGRGLKYWATIELETKIASRIEKTVQGKTVQVGEVITIKVMKNRANGVKVPFNVEFYPTVGVDNTGTSLNWLQENKYITCPGGRYKLPFLGDKGYFREDLIQKIEDGHEQDLTDYLVSCFNDWRGQMTVTRKSRFD